MRDSRDNLGRQIPVDKYSLAEFPNLDTQAVDKIKPWCAGTITNFPAVCVDTTNRKYQFHNGRFKSIQYVYKNGAVLTGGTDYYIDYQRGLIVLARALAWAANDIITVDFHGAVDAADVELTDAEKFIEIMTSAKFLGIPLADLNLDTIYAVTGSKLAIPLYNEASSDDVIKKIERSLRAWTCQDTQGRLGLRAQQTTAGSDALYVRDYHISNFKQSKDLNSVYRQVDLGYAENPQTQKPTVLTKYNTGSEYYSGAAKTLPVDTYLLSESDALVAASAALDELDKTFVEFDAPLFMFTALPGDLFYLSRNRGYCNAGTYNESLCRILGISKSLFSQQIHVKAEVV
jgi:hypothetical protein